MAKQRTPNLELVTLNDDDDSTFYPDYLENLGKIDAADQDRQDEIAALGPASTSTAVAMSIVFGG